jgi:hypothetical protein
MIRWLRGLFGSSEVAHAEMSKFARVPTSTGFWIRIEGVELGQGDFLPGCLVPSFPPDFGATESGTVELSTANLIVVTQSCDLENKKGNRSRVGTQAETSQTGRCSSTARVRY